MTDTTPTRFDELAPGDIVVEGDSRRVYLGDGRFVRPDSRVEVDGADPWDDYEVEST